MLAESVRPTRLEVSLSQLEDNLRHIHEHVQPAKVMVVLKANAYGHGVEEVSRRLEPAADYIGVAIAEEGVQLRHWGIKKPILVMGGIVTDQIPLFIDNDLTLTVPSLELLEAADSVARRLGRRITIHLKIDTGMERIGVHEYEAEPFIARALDCHGLSLEGIYTHLANSDAADLTHARLQMARFGEVLSLFSRKGWPVPPFRHAANSGAILQLPESHLDMVRAGLLLYGVYPSAECEKPVKVVPALTWLSRIAQSKITREGRPVSYGSTWAPRKPTRILTIPCGYADGYFRAMSNKSRVLIGERKYRQVGRICMDQFMVAAGGEEIDVGKDVILLGSSASGQRISVEDLASWAGTNEYEIMTNISARVPRVYLG
jgi:alanine racemase